MLRRSGVKLNDQDIISALDQICQRVGYGKACRILCELWDEMLKKEYCVTPYHGENWMKQKRSAIEAQERMQQVIDKLKKQLQESCDHYWTQSFIAGDPAICKKCGASIILDD